MVEFRYWLHQGIRYNYYVTFRFELVKVISLYNTPGVIVTPTPTLTCTQGQFLGCLLQYSEHFKMLLSSYVPMENAKYNTAPGRHILFIWTVYLRKQYTMQRSGDFYQMCGAAQLYSVDATLYGGGSKDPLQHKTQLRYNQ